MSVTVTDLSSQVISSTQQKASSFLRSMADEMVKESTPNTPRDTGQLRRNVLRQVLGLKGKVKWMMNYAVYQEEKQFRNYTTPGTGKDFAKNAAKTLPAKTQQVAKRVGLA